MIDDIENSLRAYAMSVAELTALIGKRFHLTTKHNSKDNYVLLRLLSDPTPVEMHLDDGQSEASIQFDCYATTAQKAKSIAKEIDKAFNKKGYQDVNFDVQLAIKQSRIPDYEHDSGLYRESLDYVVYYNTL